MTFVDSTSWADWTFAHRYLAFSIFIPLRFLFLSFGADFTGPSSAVGRCVLFVAIFSVVWSALPTTIHCDTSARLTRTTTLPHAVFALFTPLSLPDKTRHFVPAASLGLPTVALHRIFFVVHAYTFLCRKKGTFSPCYHFSRCCSLPRTRVW